MTDRQVGGAGARVDIIPSLDRQVGGNGLVVDYVPATGDVVGAAGATVDLRPTSSARAASLLVMVDAVVSLVPTTAVRWSGSVFEIGTSSPLVYWSSGVFQSSGTKPVVWVTDHFEEAP